MKNEVQSSKFKVLFFLCVLCASVANVWAQDFRVSVGNGLSNLTAVAVSAAVSTDQNLQQLVEPPGTLNVVGRTVRLFAGGTYTTGASGAGTMTYKLKLCTVSGCGSGTVVTLITLGPTVAQSASATNMPFICEAEVSTNATGASGTLIPHGACHATLGTTATADSASHVSQTTGASAAIDLTGQLFWQWTVADSGASANNSFTQRQATRFFEN